MPAGYDRGVEQYREIAVPDEPGTPLPEEVTSLPDLRERLKKAGERVADAMEQKERETEAQKLICIPGLLGGTLPNGETIVIQAFRFKPKR